MILSFNKFYGIILLLYHISISYANKDSLFLRNYFNTIYKAEASVCRNQNDSAYMYYKQAFDIMKNNNPKINGLRNDISNFENLKTYSKNLEEFNAIINYNAKSARYNSILENTLDSLFQVDQKPRMYRQDGVVNDSLEREIGKVDVRNFYFLNKLLLREFPLEFSLSVTSYKRWLNVILLHAASYPETKNLVKQLVTKNLHKGIIDPRLYNETISRFAGFYMGTEAGLIKLGYFDTVTKKQITDPNLYTFTIPIDEAKKIDANRHLYYLPPIAHHLQCCYYKVHHSDSPMYFYTYTFTHGMSTYQGYLDFKKNAVLFETVKP